MSEVLEKSMNHSDRAVNLFYIKGRLGWKGLRASEFIDEGPFLITGTDFFGGKVDWSRSFRISKERFIESPEIIVQPNDILITKDGTIGKVAYIDHVPFPGQASLNSHLFLVRSRSTRVHPKYSFYIFQSSLFRSYIDKKQTGSTLSGLPQRLFEQFEVPLPPIEQQQRIADILSTLDVTIEQTEMLIAKMQQVKAGLMHDLFTRGVTPDGHLRPLREQAPDIYKESPLGWIPKEWEVKSISEVFEIQLGKMLNKLAKTGKWSAPYLGNRAVQWDFVDCLAVEEMDFNPAERQKFSLLPGDLLICEGGDVGRTAIWRGEMDECFYQKAIHRLRPKSGRALPAFMLRYMRFARDNGYFREFTTQSSIAHLTQEKLGAMLMLLPITDEQDRITRRFDSLDEMFLRENSYLNKLRQQKSGLMQDLLTGRYRVPVAKINGSVHVPLDQESTT